MPKNAGLTSPFIHDVLVDAVSSLTVYAATDSGVFKTTTGGDTWFPARAGLPPGDARALVQDSVHPGALFCGVFGHGVYESLDGGQQWLAVFNQAGLPSLNVRSLAVDGGRATIYAGSDAGVSSVRNYSLTPTAVGDGVPIELPLLSAGPTPSRRGAIKISYSVHRLGPVSIVLYNVLGQRVRTLVDQEAQSIGPQSFLWDGNDQEGRETAAGVYLLRLKAPDGIRATKLVVLPE